MYIPSQDLHIDDEACLCEWYEKHPITGQEGWELYSGWLKGSIRECRDIITARQLFDGIVYVSAASPNGGERTLELF